MRAAKAAAAIFVLIAVATPARADWPFVDGFEHCTLVAGSNEDNPLYTVVGTPTIGAPNFAPAYGQEDACALRAIGISPTSETYVERTVPSLSAITTHLAMYASELNALVKRKKVFGNVIGAGLGCYAAATETGSSFGQTSRYRIDVFYADDSLRCDVGSRNPGTVCTDADNDGRDPTKCAETTDGEARCGFFPLAATGAPADDWQQFALDEDHGSGEVTCGLTRNGGSTSTGSQKAGTCSKDSYLCASDVDCQPNLSGANWSGVTNGRCTTAGTWTLQNPYPVDETLDAADRCRTAQGNADCDGGETCSANTCVGASVGAVTKTFVGLRGSTPSTGDNYSVEWDDWMGASANRSDIIYARVRDVYPTGHGVVDGWTKNNCDGGVEEGCVDDLAGGATAVDQNTTINSGTGATVIDDRIEYLMQNGSTVIQLQAGTCSTNLCSGGPVPGAFCLSAADCTETLAANARVSFVVVAEDQSETCDGDDDGGGTKGLRLSSYDRDSANKCDAAETNACSEGDTVILGDNICGSFYPDAESTFTTDPSGGTWSEAELEKLAFEMKYTWTSDPGSQRGIRATAALASFDVTMPRAPCNDVIADINGDGEITVAVIGDSTYADSVFQGELDSAICEPTNLLECTAGSKTTGDVEADFAELLDGVSSATAIPGGLNCTAIRGAPCDTGPCNGVDVALVGIGLNSIAHGEAPSYFDGGRCFSPGRAENGAPCSCPQSSGARNTTQSGFCMGLLAGSYQGGMSEGATCSPSASNPCTTIAGSGSCALVAGTCVTNACTAPTAPWNSLGEVCTKNADCDVPVKWCDFGCKNVAGCVSGTCIGSPQSFGGLAGTWEKMAAVVRQRNADAPTTNNVKLVVVSQPMGTYTGSAAAGLDGGCWTAWWRQFDAHAGRLRAWAAANGFGWIDHNLYAKENCPEGDRGLCTRDGVHYSDEGAAIAAEVFRRCLQNVAGTSAADYDCDF